MSTSWTRSPSVRREAAALFNLFGQTLTFGESTVGFLGFKVPCTRPFPCARDVILGWNFLFKAKEIWDFKSFRRRSKMSTLGTRSSSVSLSNAQLRLLTVPQSRGTGRSLSRGPPAGKARWGATLILRNTFFKKKKKLLLLSALSAGPDLQG